MRERRSEFVRLDLDSDMPHELNAVVCTNFIEGTAMRDACASPEK